MPSKSLANLAELIARLDTCELRNLIAAAAQQTPEVIYTSGDFHPSEEGLSKIGSVSKGLVAAAARALVEIPPGHGLTCAFTGLSNTRTGPYGDWVVKIDPEEDTAWDMDPEEGPSASWKAAREICDSLDPEEVRPFLSENARSTPNTIYVTEGFAANLEGAVNVDKGPRSALAGAAQYLCSQLRDTLDAGGTFETKVNVAERNTGLYASFKITVTRQTTG